MIFRTAAVLTALLALPALAQTSAGSDAIPDRRLIYESGVDYYGDDLRAIFDTTEAACRSACLADPDCRAFTFNTASNACFPKRGVSRREAYPAAISAEVVTPQPLLRSEAVQRRSTLTFLRPQDLEAALVEAGALPRRYPRSGLALPQIVFDARSAEQSGDIPGALALWGQAVALADAPDAWRNYGRLAWAYRDNNNSATNRVRRLALPGAINAYLRAVDPEEAAASLDLMASLLQESRRGRASIPALRLAQSIAPSDPRLARIDTAIDLYGFRITDSRSDAESAAPRLCITFTEQLAKGVDFSPYVSLPGVSFAAEAEGQELCLDGVQHGQRYTLTVRAGLPAASGEVLARDAALNLYVRDRSPSVSFPGRAFVLPKGPETAVPVETVNAEVLDLRLFRVPDRNLRGLIEDGAFARPIASWDLPAFAETQAEEIWDGVVELAHPLEDALNRNVMTRVPLEDALSGQLPGLYVLQARVPDTERTPTLPATQWFVVSDIGLASIEGNDGLHVFSRSLGTAAPIGGLEVALLSRANRVLATGQTDALGHVQFAPGLARGSGAAAPALVTATTQGDADFAFLPLTGPAFDLSDRGVEGRPSPGPIDVFLSTERGAYRAGETIHATAIARDGEMAPLADLPLTAILTRPDGVEFARQTVTADAGGGLALSLQTSGAALRGTWRLAVHADPEAPPLAVQNLLVEDFLPERIDADLTLPEGAIRLSDVPRLGIAARYLFGAPGAGLAVEGETLVRGTLTLPEHPGYSFGPHDAVLTPVIEPITPLTTGEDGRADIALRLPVPEGPARPMEAEVRVRVSEGSGRPIERRVTRALTPESALIGVRPLFDGTLPEGSEAAFDVIATNFDAGEDSVAIRWSLDRVETRYQWYTAYGEWNWEPVTRRSRVATGDVVLGPDPERIAAPVGWGRYELLVERVDGPYTLTSVAFDAGWYAPADAAAAPDRLTVALDKPAYVPGEMANLRIEAQSAGTALVTVLTDRLLDMVAVEVSAGTAEIPLPVTEAWGAGAYVAASLIRPLHGAEGRAPVRALGLAHAAVDPGAREIAAEFEMPDQLPPRSTMEAVLRVDGVDEGVQVWATIAAVDQGILNVTGFEPPDAPGHYFGQRALGVDLRDLYGRLIDGRSGAMGRIRAGGDAADRMRMDAPPPTEELVAFFSGPVTVGADRTARASFDLPSFNGEVKLMATVWSDDGAVGMADATVVVRDPVVITASLPRFLAPGDTGTLRLDFAHTEGPSGEMSLDVEAEGIALASVPASIQLADQGRTTLSLPLSAPRQGIRELRVRLGLPDGTQLEKDLTLRVEDNDPAIARTSRFSLALGDTFTLSSDVFADFRPGSGTATLALGPLARFDAPGLLTLLNTYPYGCTEQVTSAALPLLYMSDLAGALGLDEEDDLDRRIEDAIMRVLANQSSSGGFGLWRPDAGDSWLDAYVTDFLSQARASGFDVPDSAFTAALDNLSNRVATAPGFEPGINGGGAGIAYALAVLAREGRARIGDLRYYADAKGGDFGSALAAAHLGAALAAYGEQGRADTMFSRAEGLLGAGTTGWRADYGTPLRDAAGLLTLASQSGSTAIDRQSLANRVAAGIGAERLSTQEAVWSILALNSLAETGATIDVDGAPAEGPLVRVMEDKVDAAPIAFTNRGAEPIDLTLTTLGTPSVPAPPGGEGFAIERTYYTMEGVPADPSSVRQGTRLVTLLTVTPFGPADGRLMIEDALPAGFEIDNPRLLRGGDIRGLDWLETAEPRMAQFLDASFRAAVDWRSDAPFRLAYIVRAVSPGSYHHPPALVEDMYRPNRRAVGAAGRVDVFE